MMFYIVATNVTMLVLIPCFLYCHSRGFGVGVLNMNLLENDAKATKLCI